MSKTLHPRGIQLSGFADLGSESWISRITRRVCGITECAENTENTANTERLAELWVILCNKCSWGCLFSVFRVLRAFRDSARRAIRKIRGMPSIFADLGSESRNARSTRKTRKRPLARIVLLIYGLFFAINVHGGVFSVSSAYSAPSVIPHAAPFEKSGECHRFLRTWVRNRGMRGVHGVHGKDRCYGASC